MLIIQWCLMVMHEEILNWKIGKILLKILTRYEWFVVLLKLTKVKIAAKRFYIVLKNIHIARERSEICWNILNIK